ncbi:putative kinetoplast-associated protein p18-2 [Leptomonas pyrrhocoris]|uniref:Putative kinetoplast-associated protein p18-2 n=1 Tax=Leptomonas pyrrhocoris TaxID=157538 RepID=A0A0M9G908_LEPPY|nr:putative kinetoplast-associated protein p18-2 [Leptomonas pyrrhocoris]XP_015663465.1 putative kinetoplast-associated protein p18-2 [Leptomonas pyrrhocoris]KPA85025.1 putative kinetoplast-associated protein p18-2 [Leptomonas pyrrhocoris]KPA85026.1 putative kinetoplast-associated protein p18-2 [Leptomonas pyrrhocoris]|eukprot:XP_015663464.1 putative kinetoplast-associated protein p18-2 [Leptomonas pyrrhocoris]
MLRRTQTFLKVSPYFLFLKDLSKAGKLKGVRNPGKHAAKQYRQLSSAAKSALVKRAQSTTFSSAEAYKRMAKREMAHKNVPMKQRYAQLRQKWAAVKKAQRKATKPAAAKKPKSAKSKVKKAGKKAKKASA